MAISYPLDFPDTGLIKRLRFRPRAAVAVSVSPFTFAQQTFAHQGDLWEAVVELVDSLERADAEDLNAFILSLNGREGSFLLGDSKHPTARGTWSGGAPVLNGAHSAGAKTLSIIGAEGLAWEGGDWFQVGTGSSTHLHKVVQAGSQPAGSPVEPANLEIWPALREDLADAAALVLASPLGQWRLAEGWEGWTLDPEAPFIPEPLHLVEKL